jgi:hypothetical protein
MGTQLYQSGGDDHGAVVETNENQVPEVGMQEASGDPDRIAGDQDNDNETGAKAHVPLSDAEKRQLLSKLEPLLASPESLTPVWQWLNGDIEYLLIAYGRVYAEVAQTTSPKTNTRGASSLEKRSGLARSGVEGFALPITFGFVGDDPAVLADGNHRSYSVHGKCPLWAQFILFKSKRDMVRYGNLVNRQRKDSDVLADALQMQAYQEVGMSKEEFGRDSGYTKSRTEALKEPESWQDQIFKSAADKEKRFSHDHGVKLHEAKKIKPDLDAWQWIQVVNNEQLSVLAFGKRLALAMETELKARKDARVRRRQAREAGRNVMQAILEGKTDAATVNAVITPEEGK